jgi:hypothetical protein
VGVTLPLALKPGSTIEIIPASTPEASTIRGKLVYSRQLEHVWLCGCALESPMRDSAIRAWLAGPPA